MELEIDWGMTKTAILSECGKYRYSLTRSWNPEKERVCFVMLNPSTADASNDDPTILRCIAFAKAWGYGSIEVVNLFAYRATDPRELKNVGATVSVGPLNDKYLKLACDRSELTVAAWGVHGALWNRGQTVRLTLSEAQCLGVTKEGHPRHPLYVRADEPRVSFGYE